MKVELKIYRALCATEIFEINGKDADSGDFGMQEDTDQENAEDWCCGNMQFTRKPSTKKILKKYSITEEEYQEICEQLEIGLSFGCCGWCS